jgi:4-amino-4-deoxy-L-arabinose transferase-like glycosyltransferase
MWHDRPDTARPQAASAGRSARSAQVYHHARPSGNSPAPDSGGFDALPKAPPREPAREQPDPSARGDRSVHADPERLWTRRLGWLLAGLFAARIAYLAVVPLELCPDEAYYWDWSRQLDWGYYSKPPMIAWLIRLATTLGGTSEWAIRLPAAVLGTLGLYAVFALARAQYGARVGFWSTVAVAATPGMTALNVLMTIDAPFLFAWAFALWCVWELFGSSGAEPTRVEPARSRREEGSWLLAAVLCTGFGLLSKQTMLAIFPLTLLWLASDAEGRRHLRRATVWLWMMGSLCCVLPVVWWNARHDWVTVWHTREHFQPRAVSIGEKLLQGVEFVGSQFGVVSPLSCGLMVWLGAAAVCAWPRIDRRLRFLACFSPVPLLGVLGLSFVQKVQPNWPAAFHLTALVLLSAWGCGAVVVGRPAARPFRWLTSAILVGALLAAGVLAAPFLVPHSPWAGGRLDPLARLRGWKSLGTQLGRQIAEVAPRGQVLIIAATGRGPVSPLAYYLPGQPRVYRWNCTGQIECQHDVWGGPPAVPGATAVIVTQGASPVPAELAKAFDRLIRIDTISADRGGARREELTIWRGEHEHGGPLAEKLLAIDPDREPTRR